MSHQAPDDRSPSISERNQFVEDIRDSVASEDPDSVQLTSAQRSEIERRLDAHDADPGSALAWDAVRSDLFRLRRSG